MNTPYPIEELDADEDDGTMPANVATLAQAVVGHRIVKAEKVEMSSGRWWKAKRGLVLTLDDGTRVTLANDGDCCQ